MPESQPLDDYLASAFGAGTQGETERRPSAEPPATAGAGVSGGVTAWVNSQKINALWTIAENRNSWVGVAGVGWKKLANNSDSAIVALTILSANAKQTQGGVNYREEADTMIHEMYVW